MPTREQLTNERLDALIELMVSEGVIEQKEARLLRGTRDFREAPELAKGLRERREGRENKDTQDEDTNDPTDE